MIEDLGHHRGTKLTSKEMVLDKALRSPFFDDSKEIGWAYDIKEFKRSVMIKRPYQHDIAVSQLAKLRSLELFYDYVDKFFSRQDFELCSMDRDSVCLEMSGDSLDEIDRSELKQAYETDMKTWFATDRYKERTPGLFKPKFAGTRGVWLTAKCQLVQNKT